MKHASLWAAAAAILLGNFAHAQIPVTDVAVLAQQIQQVEAWVQQYNQMVTQLTQGKQAYQSITGSRGLQALENGTTQQNARRYLPGDLSQIISLYTGSVVPGYAALTTRINTLQGQISTLPPGYFPAGSTAQAELTRITTTLATQRALAEAAFNASTNRTPSVETMLATIGTSTDPKAMQELQTRITGEQVITANETNRIQVLAYQQQVQRQQDEHATLEHFASAQRASIPTVTFPSVGSN